jgi:flagellar assembly protein FliH
MWSKVLLPGDPRLASPLVWRQVGGAGPDEGGEPAAGPARTEQLELACRQKVREAREAGLCEGETAGRNRAAAELQPVIERLARAIQEISNLRARLRREAEADVVKLALAIARRVVRREVAADPDALRGLVIAALEKLQGQEISRVKVHPSHVALVTSCLQQALSGGTVEVLPDPARQPGSVIFETTRGNLDASVDAQLQEIERGLADRLGKQS